MGCHNSSKGSIFRFSVGASDCPLFVRGPRDEIGAKKDTKPTNRFFFIGVASPIGVEVVGLEGAGGILAK